MVAAVACLAADRDWFRNRLADHSSGRARPTWAAGSVRRCRPTVADRRRAAASASRSGRSGTPCTCWPRSPLLSLAWDVGARRLAGAGWRANLALLRDGIPAFVSLVVLAAVVYVAHLGRLVGHDGWLRPATGGADTRTAQTVRLLGEPLASLLHYQHDIYDFHTGDFINHAQHAYRANPIGWLVLARPIGIDAVNGIQPGTDGCPGPDTCLRVISAHRYAGAVVGRDVRPGRRADLVGRRAGLAFRDPGRRRAQRLAALVPVRAPSAVLLLRDRDHPVLGDGASRCVWAACWAGAEPADRRMIGGILVGAFVALVGAELRLPVPDPDRPDAARTQWLARMWFAQLDLSSVRPTLRAAWKSTANHVQRCEDLARFTRHARRSVAGPRPLSVSAR